MLLRRLHVMHDVQQRVRTLRALEMMWSHHRVRLACACLTVCNHSSVEAAKRIGHHLLHAAVHRLLPIFWAERSLVRRLERRLWVLQLY